MVCTYISQFSCIFAIWLFGYLLVFREVVKKKSILNSIVLVAIWEPAIKYRSAYNYPVSESKLELKSSPTAGFRIIFVVVDSTKYTSNFLSQNNRKRGIFLKR